MIINHILQRREARRQRKAQWMLSRCFTQEVQITDIIIEQVQSTSSMPTGMEPIIISYIIIEEPVITEEPVMIVVEPIVIEKAIIPVKAIDEASEELRKLLILHQTIKKLSSKKSNLTLCI